VNRPAFARLRRADRIVGDAGGGSNPVRAVQRYGVQARSAGLESSNNHLAALFQSALDCRWRELLAPCSQFRVDAFNAPNQGVIIPQNGQMAGATLTLSNPNDPLTIVNNQFNAAAR
jgi:hypothetical protein